MGRPTGTVSSASKAAPTKNRLAGFSTTGSTGRKSFPGALAPGSSGLGKSASSKNVRARFLERAILELYMKAASRIDEAARKCTASSRRVLLDARSAVHSAMNKALSSSKAKTHNVTQESQAIAERLEERKGKAQDELSVTVASLKKMREGASSTRANALASFRGKGKALLAKFKAEVMA